MHGQEARIRTFRTAVYFETSWGCLSKGGMKSLQARELGLLRPEAGRRRDSDGRGLMGRGELLKQ